MRIFLTGATGFVGTNLTETALSRGHHVTALKRRGSQPAFNLEREPDWIEGDLLTSIDESLWGGCDVFIHAASHGVSAGQMNDWEECFRWNVEASLALWLKAVQGGVKRFIIVGSCFEYGLSGEKQEYIDPYSVLLPTAAYHASKAAASQAAFALGVDRKLSMSILRPFHVFGRGEPEYRFWPMLKEAAQKGEDFLMTEGEQVRDFIPVEQVCAQIIQEMEDNCPEYGAPEIRNLGTGIPQSLADFARHWWNEWNAPGTLHTGAVPYRSNEVMRYVPKI